MKYVINRRLKGAVRDHMDWKVVAEFNTSEVETMVPASLREHWERDKGPLGYARLTGLSVDDLKTLAALTKGAVARLGVNRWGEIHCYKLVTPP